MASVMITGSTGGLDLMAAGWPELFPDSSRPVTPEGGQRT